MNEEIQLELSKLSDEIQKIVRRVDELQKSVDLFYKDREILEEIQGSIKALQATSLATREHHDNAINSVKTDIKDAQFQVEDKVDEVKKEIANKTVIVKSTSKGLFAKLKQMVEKR